MTSTAAPKVERVGVLLVHGIGEQGRFDHLENQTRQIAEAISKLNVQPAVHSSVHILPATGGATCGSTRESWRADGQPVIQAIVRMHCPIDGFRETHIFFHEVWWADVNERPSVVKSINFWAWGISVWNLPEKAKSKRKGYELFMRPPRFPDRVQPTDTSHTQLLPADRRWLELVANVFVISGLALTLLFRLLSRIWKPLRDPTSILVSYVSGVRLYSQQSRDGGNSLDDLDEPPRTTIRRRMVRGLADMVINDYSRWYVIAHSLGTVVAHNGLMEPAHTLANYLDQDRWTKLVGRGATGSPYLCPDDASPRRPLWLGAHDAIDRGVFFQNLRGFLTFGSPLDKFAALWPAKVAIHNDLSPFNGVQWVNVFDPVDPVSGHLDAFAPNFAAPSGTTSFEPQNLGYRAGRLLLANHVKYLAGQTKQQDTLVSRVVKWLVCGGAMDVSTSTPLWYDPDSQTAMERMSSARRQWIAIYVLADLLASLAIAGVVRLAGGASAITALAVFFGLPILVYLIVHFLGGYWGGLQKSKEPAAPFGTAGS